MAGDTESGDKKFLEFAAGDVVLPQGQIAKGLYILMSGTIEVFFDGVRVAEISQKGAFVGEIASLLGGRRIATVKAATPVRMMVIDRVSEYLEKNPSTALLIAQTLATRIMAMNKKFAHFEQIAQNWISVAQNAVQTLYIAPIKQALADMQAEFKREIKAG
jgi:CRP-like cAMP-binding protein